VGNALISTGQIQVDAEAFFDWSVDMLAVAGVDGYFKRLNPAWEATLGWTSEQLMARPYLDFVHPEDRQATMAEASRIAGGDWCLSFVNRYRCRDESYRWLHWTSRPHLAQGLVYAVARDVTAQKEAERALKESEERLHLALRAARMGLWEWDSTRGTVKLTPGTGRLVGLSETGGELSPDLLLRLLDPEDLPEARRLLGRNGDFSWTFRVQGADGTPHRIATEGKAFADDFGRLLKATGTLRRAERV
jgi:PAS domain S-box-containing protein